MRRLGSARCCAHRFSWLVLSSALGLLHCRRKPEPERASTAEVSAAARTSGSERAEPPPALPVAMPLASSSPSLAPDLQGAPSTPLHAGLNQWLESSLYRFKVASVHDCSGAAPVAAASVSAAGSELRLCVRVSITAKVDSLLASPRDIALERDGVILQAELQPSAASGAPLPTKQLRRGESAVGAVNFVVPSRDFAKRLKLHFSPTRWGGAPPATVELPECLADCAGASENAR
jgi:hypothetical protein